MRLCSIYDYRNYLFSTDTDLKIKRISYSYNMYIYIKHLFSHTMISFVSNVSVKRNLYISIENCTYYLKMTKRVLQAFSTITLRTFRAPFCFSFFLNHLCFMTFHRHLLFFFSFFRTNIITD